MREAVLAADLGLLLVETLLICAIILSLYHWRAQLGSHLLYVTLGGLQYFLGFANLVRWELLPGWAASPSDVIFAGTLFAVLLVYIREDAGAARDLIHGLLCVNLSLALLCVPIGLHARLLQSHSGNPINIDFLGQSTTMVAGILILWFDAVLLILIYEFVFKHCQELFVSTFVSISSVLVLDTVLYQAMLFFPRQDVIEVVLSVAAVKVAASLLYSAALTVFLRRQVKVGSPAGFEIPSPFQVLTYRQKFEILQREAEKDGLTGVYNRQFFDRMLESQVESAYRLGQPLALFMADIDSFKRFNDLYGHEAGDQVLRIVASLLKESVRTTDFVCRYGGEEFAIVLTNVQPHHAVRVAQQIRERVASTTGSRGREGALEPLTITIGVACFPSEASTAGELLSMADRRLLEGKRMGRDRVVRGESADRSVGGTIALHPGVRFGNSGSG